jgi:hypothetical protein
MYVFFKGRHFKLYVIVTLVITIDYTTAFNGLIYSIFNYYIKSHYGLYYGVKVIFK